MADEQQSQKKTEGLESIECLGAADKIAPQILETIGSFNFFEAFSEEDIAILASQMTAYRAKPGDLIINEGDMDDYMLLILEGSVNIVKVDSHGEIRPMSVVRAGSTLGEMSMIDGEPRFASCIAIDSTIFAVLARDDMVELILNQPSLGAKILIKLVTLLSQRLRTTSNNLLQFMERTDTV